MITGKDIIYVSSIDWDFLWQGHQEIATRLAAAGNRVLFIENTGVRSLRLKDGTRLLARLRNWLHNLRTGGVRKIAANIYVCSPVVLPPLGSAWQREINRRLFLPLIARAARKLNMRGSLLWTYLPTDTALDVLELLRTPESVLVYYCADNFTQVTTNPQRLRETETALLEVSDLVFTTCSELASHCKQWNANVHVFPSGVNMDVFPLEPDVRGSDHYSPNGKLRRLQRPVIGYIGGLHSHVDFALLTEVARSRPLWSVVLVGALQTSPGELSTLSNVHFMGQQPHGSLAAYLREFDVCIVPYINSAYTATVVPTKINEYLALGKPVVSTNLPSVVEFNQKHKILQISSPRPNEFLQAIEQALQLPNDGQDQARRREVAKSADWRIRLEAMSELIEAAFAKKAFAKKNGLSKGD